MRKWIGYILLAGIFFIGPLCQGQVRKDPLDSLFALLQKGDGPYIRNQYDSALVLYKKAEQWSLRYKLDSIGIVSILYNNMGDCYRRKKEATAAHQYLTKALLNSRRFRHSYEKQTALTALIGLHQEIAEKNLAFAYPAVAETEETNILVILGPVVSNSDSLDIIIPAGRWDGITDSLQMVEVDTHITGKDTAMHNNIALYGKARILSVGNNQTRLRVKKNPHIQLLQGDFAALKAGIPIRWRQLSLRSFLVNSLYFADNYRQLLYHYRYLYYYGDSTAEADILELAKVQVAEVADVLANDTAVLAQFPNAIAAGIFKGENMIPAMRLSRPEHLRLFLNYVKRYQAKYVGNNYKFSETYATWVINNTPLDPPDIKPYLLTFSGDERKKKITDLLGQINEEAIPDTWLDEGMQATNIENISDARRTATLLTDYISATVSPHYSGWNEYLLATIEKKEGNTPAANSSLSKAKTLFETYHNTEGLRWISSTQEFWSKTKKIAVGIQSGHFLSYTIAQSPNPRYYATGGYDSRIKIWDRSLGKEILTLGEHTDAVTSLQYSPNGRYLLSASKDSTVRVWNAYTYGLMYTFKNTGPAIVARFTPDNKMIVTGGADSLIRFRDLQSGAIVKTLRLHKGRVNDLQFDPIYNNTLYSCSSDSMIYKWDVQAEEMVYWMRQKGKVLSVRLSNDGKYMSAVSTDSLLTVWTTETKKRLFTSKVNVHSSGSSVFYAGESFTPDSKYIAFPFARDSFYIVDLKDIRHRAYWTNKPENHLEELVFSNDGMSLYGRFFFDGLLRIYNFSGWDLDRNTSLNWKDIRQYGNVVSGVQFAPDDNSLIVVHSEISRIDLRNGNKERLYQGNIPMVNRTVLLNDDKTGTYFDSGVSILHLYDYKRDSVLRQFSLPAAEKAASLTFSPGNTYCYLGGKNGSLAGWETATGKKLFTTKINGADPAIYGLEYDDHHHRLYVVRGDENVLLVDPDNGRLLDSLPVRLAYYIAASQKKIYISTGDGWLYIYDAASLALRNKIQLNTTGEAAGQLQLTPDQQYLAIQNTTFSIAMLRTIDDSILYTIPDQENASLMLSISHDGRQMATAGLAGKVHLYETATGKRLVSIHLPLDKGIMITDDEEHYLTTKNTLDAIQFTYNSNAYSFDQFDLQLNRPDIVLQKIGKADTSLVKAYRDAYAKRLRRLKLSEQDNVLDLHLPLVRLREKYTVPPVTTRDEFELAIECSDSRYPIQSLQVLVNNVPVLGAAGLDLRSLQTQQTVQRVKIPLSVNNNSIKVYCTNSKGVSSLRESFEVISKYKPLKPPATYFIGIAVADYKDRRMSLRYPVKDVRDLAKTFDALSATITIDTLINSKATRQQVLALKKRLLKTSVNDKVILAVTGHGLLSDSLDFYYATWDMDFKHPEKKGIRYEELEDLLTNIPAREKLMLIDACHSGALDKEELLAVTKDAGAIAGVKTGGTVTGIAARGTITESSEAKMSANSSFELMQNLFTDLSGNSGAVVISAAGGMEYAYESSAWNNGVFTYCVRKGLEEKTADRLGNNDRNISVQELLNYVSNTVSSLTNGRQKPVSRRENIDYDWILRSYR